MDLRYQMEELRRRIDTGPQRVQIIDLADRHPVADLLGDPSGDDAGAVIYKSGMTMADVEKRAIEAALLEHHGNRRKAAEVLGIGERTLYRKIKAFGLG
jgi:DNA-binding NtrC family response regulator